MMESRVALALFVSALLVVPAVSVAAVTGSPELSAQFTDKTVVPGEDTTVELVIVNEGTVTSGSNANTALNSRVTTARGLTVTLNDGNAPITIRSNRKAIGNLGEGVSSPLSFEVAVADDAEPGSYETRLHVEYVYTDYISESDGTRQETSVSRTISVPIRVTDTAQFQVTDVDSAARVGSTGTVALTVKNTGSETANSTSLTLESTSSDLTFGTGSSATRHVGRWEPGETRRIKYRVTADSDAVSDTYPFQLSAEFEGTGGVEKTSRTMSIGVPTAPEQEFTVVDTDSDVAVGSTGAYTVTVRNDGPIDIHDATVKIASSNSDITFGSGSSTTQYVGEWAAGENRTITVDATASDDARTREYALTTTVSYEDGEGDSETTSGLSVGLQPEPEQAFDIENVESTMQVGDEGVLRGTVTNTGNQTARDAVIKWTGDQRNINPTETEYAVGTLEPGESAEFAFDVEVSDAGKAGPKQFTFVTEYQNSDGETRTSEDLTVRQSVAPAADEFDVTIKDASVQAGKGRTIRMTVTNTDNQTLSDISAKLFADSPVSTTDDEAFIADLKPGESTTITFGIRVSGSALTKTYPLSMDFQYEEADGDTITSDTYKVPVQVERPSDGGGGPPILTIAVVALLAIVAAGGYYRYR